MESPTDQLQAKLNDPTSELTPLCLATTNAPASEAKIEHETSELDTFSKYKDNFFKEAQFSPDGTCIVTHTNDGSLSTFVLPQDLLDESKHPHNLTPYSVLQSPTNVQSYALYPRFELQDLSTTLVLSAPADQPLRLTNAINSDFTHATYPYIHSRTEAYISPNSLIFHQHGGHFVAGSQGAIAVFDTTRENENPVAKHITKPKNPMPATQSMRDAGRIMALDISDDGHLAAGSSNRTVGIFPNSGHKACETAFSVAPERGSPEAAICSGTGITSLSWTPDGHYLLVGERQSDGIHVYDMRNQRRRVAWLAGRKALTTQRLGFSTVPIQTGLEVWAGGMDGIVRMWRNPGREEGVQQPDSELEGMHSDSVTSAVWHPGGAVMATCSGHRRFDVEDDDDEDGHDGMAPPDNTLKVWSL